MAKRVKLTRGLFLEKAKELHGDKYDYTKTEINDTTRIKSKIFITCKKHGIFKTWVGAHLNGKGCRLCGIKAGRNRTVLTFEKFKEKANSVHDNKYNYEEKDVFYNNEFTKVTCDEHGSFEIKIRDHLNGKGCKQCALINQGKKSSEVLKLRSITDGKRADILHDKQKLIDFINDEKIKTLGDLATRLSYTISPVSAALNNLGIRDMLPKKSSYFESIVENWLVSNDVNYIARSYDQVELRNERGNKKQLDFVIMPKKEIAIEVNDTASHNATRGYFSNSKDTIKPLYHQQKTLQCKEKGVRLIHLFEKDLNDLDNFLSCLLPKKRAHSRKVKFKKIKGKEVKQFFDENHRQKCGQMTEAYCLVDKQTEEIMCAMTFRRARNKSKFEYELYRFANKKGYTVSYGASRLFHNHFLKDNPDIKLIGSYCDLTYNTGQVYESLGFKLSHISAPNYKWVKKDEWLTRDVCQRHKLSKRFDNEEYNDKTWTENSIMENEGYVKVYDAGNSVYVYSR